MLSNEQKIQLLKENHLTEEDTFEFGCDMCGECCRNRHDILLQPYDIFRIAKYLETDILSVIKKYCECYIGQDSKLPMVRAKPKLYNDVCPFLRKGKCGIHEVKPAVCSLYPLGRAVSPSGEIRYFVQRVPCGTQKRKIKVKDWLEEFNLKESEEPATEWGKTIVRLSVGKKKYRISADLEDKMNKSLHIILYLNYDVNKEFMPQFRHNLKKAEEFFELSTGKSIERAVKNMNLGFEKI